HFRGCRKVQIQCLLAATAQNIKKIALLVAVLCWFYRWLICKFTELAIQSRSGKGYIGDQ
ncbi:hypothetical protein, partial [Xenorhabdus koppenhoeferi]|uniref:hypothetical protein n=1 Tax=Xenorhabdus koppenhoeferi TaxID=351659 RepID=UPI002B40A645